MRVMNAGLQQHVLKKVVVKNLKEHGYTQHEIDPILEETDFEALIDPSLTLGENIDGFFRLGILKAPYLSDEEISSQEYEYAHELELKLANSISKPYYKCEVEGCEFSTKLKNLMVDHYFEEHDLESDFILPANPDDMTYIVLEKLVDLALSTDFRRKRYVPVSNKALHELLLHRLGFEEDDKYAPSNQKPRQILDALGLLEMEKYQRINTIGFDNKSRRIYNINKNKIRSVVEGSIYKGLVLKIHTSLTPFD